MTKKLVIFGCKDTTLHLLRHVKGRDIEVTLVTLAPDLAKRHEVAGYIDLSCEKNIFETVYRVEKYSLTSSLDQGWIASRLREAPGLCIGWQRLIPNELLSAASYGIYGMHGSTRDLPFGKGRSPLNWSIIEDRKFFTTNLFRYNCGVDDGPILNSQRFSIQASDTAETLHYKNTLAMCNLLDLSLDSIYLGTASFIPQSTADGESFYPKRVVSDSVIDWRDDIFNLERLIRAVSPPFSGALSSINQQVLTINRVSIFYTDLEDHAYRTAEFGRVLEVFPSGKFLVRCSGGVLLVHDYLGSNVSKNQIFSTSQPSLKRFDRNDYGFFDV